VLAGTQNTDSLGRQQFKTKTTPKAENIKIHNKAKHAF
jgi:hypothetical protein